MRGTANLAAFAMSAKMRFVTFDLGFQQFVPFGLHLDLLREKRGQEA
jgi:hypothetical protein